MCVEHWVEENIERVQSLRDEASANYRETSADRKGNWDKASRPRKFKVGERVWYRTPRLIEALQPSWVGPYEITKLMGPQSYELSINERKKCVHIKFLKEWTGRSVKRVTTTPDDNTEADDILETNPKVEVEPGGMNDTSRGN